MLNEKPKSIARVKNCSAPSKRCAASSSSVRSTASGTNSSGPISFCPPSPCVAVTSVVRNPLPCEKYASIALFSSSGCAVVIMNDPTVSSLRNASSSAGSPLSAATGWS